MSQGQRNKQPSGANKPSSTSASSRKSPVLFTALIAVVVALGASGIYYKIRSRPKPIVLSETALVPKSDGYLLGDPNAPVTIIEFADFECEQCASFAAITEPDVRKRLIDTGLANMRFYDFPIVELHPNSLFASLAASCAADQGKFWPMHDVLLARQGEWEGHTRNKPNPTPEFESYAKEIKLDMARYKACFDSRENVPRINAHYKAGLELQVQATPSFVIGGTLYRGNQPYDAIKTAVEVGTVKAGAGRTEAK